MPPKRLRPDPTAMETSGRDNGADNPIEENVSFAQRDSELDRSEGHSKRPRRATAEYLIPMVLFRPAHARKRHESAINVR
ncbi:hypothetical protein M427DRAFT_132160 [Gonapodya prolifera JEL478]|uniref:Uncharacterized protein n=1 Tax=Gonapodya prolifera (strain JEL478) TaxID=1344416 RepID=A0A139ARI9_GONPJ|nr:hypothetical protein M427DRAFT_132160 [Gonapodya prolifera JEL478]|eukprot:KXS19115.1 hypothetical protein M427DRAFT_132160 [Gonapodya prolifera JEL478]